MEAPQTSNALEPIRKSQTSFAGGQRDRDHPSMLNPDEYHRGINLEVREAGFAATRRGKTTKTDGVGAQFQGCIYFDPPDDAARIVQVNAGQFWEWQGTGTTWTRIGVTQLTNISDRVGLVVLNGKFFCFAGNDDAGRYWDGTAGDLSTMGDTNTDAPKGSIVCQQSGRLCLSGVASTATIANARSHIFYSDIFDGTVWNRTTNNSRVPTNGDEAVTALASYRKEEILAFTRNSSHIFGIGGSTVSNFTRQTLDPTVGCVAPDSVQVVGEDAFFVSSDKQVRTIKRTQLDIAYGVSVPITFDNPNLFDRLNKNHVASCSSAYFDNYYLLAGPFNPVGGSSTYNVSVAPFDALHQKQSSTGVVPICLGEWTNYTAGGFVISNFNDVPQLYYIDAATGAAVLCFDGTTDDGAEIPITIDGRAEDFGYPNNEKTMHSMEIQVLDTYGLFSLNYAMDGDSSFSSFYTNKQISDPSLVNLPIPALPFNLPVGGILSKIRARFYRKGRSNYWQWQIIHTSGPINIKYISMRAFVEEMNTRN